MRTLLLLVLAAVLAHVLPGCEATPEDATLAPTPPVPDAAPGGAGSAVRPAKLCIYAIALNERKHVQHFMAASQPAQAVAVADLGSTDGTVEALEAAGANVTRVSVQPFRFDTARNIALSLLPPDCDLCVGLDLADELQPGWAQALLGEWNRSSGTVTEVRSTYVRQFAADGAPLAQHEVTAIHARSGYRWDGPAHEVLQWTGRGGAGGAVPAVLPDLALHSKAGTAKDCWRHVCRHPYLSLLRMGAKEDAASPRRSYYYGRALYHMGAYEEGIVELERYLALEGSTDKEQRSAARQHIAGCHEALGRLKEAQTAALRGVLEWQESREPWLEVAHTSYRLSDWSTMLWAASCALAIDKPSLDFGDPASFGFQPYDYAALASFNLGYYEAALAQGEKALALEPANERLQDNLRFYREKSRRQPLNRAATDEL